MKKNILFITEKYPPFTCSGNRIYNLSKHLSKNHNITILCRQNNNFLFPINIDKTIPLLKNIKIINFKIYDDLLLLPSKLLYKLKLIKQFNQTSYINQIKKIVNNNSQIFSNFNLIIASAPSWDSFKGAEYLHDKFNIPFILDYRDPWIPRNKKELNSQKRIINKAKAIVTVNNYVSKEIKEISNYKKKITIIENGSDKDLFSKLVQKKISNKNKINIGYAGSLITYQNIDKLFYAVANQLENIKKNIVINIFGKDQFKKHSHLAKKLKINVKLNGFTPQNILKEKLNICDLFYIGHSINNATSGKFYIYLALNKPILLLTSKKSQLDVIFKNNKLGFINYNVDELSKTIYKIYNNKKLLNKNKFNIKKYIKNYDWKILAKKYEELL
jgi:hypothetical protein